MIAWGGRLLAFLILALLGWFLWFAVVLPGPAPADERTDAIVVLTGGPGRLARGIDLLKAKRAERMLVSGVDPSVRAVELASETKATQALFDCCIDLGREAVDTRTNASETAAWLRARRYRSVRLVTSSYHMRRAHLELTAEHPEVEIIADAVPFDMPAGGLLREFGKYALRRGAILMGI